MLSEAVNRALINFVFGSYLVLSAAICCEMLYSEGKWSAQRGNRDRLEHSSRRSVSTSQLCLVKMIRRGGKALL